MKLMFVADGPRDKASLPGLVQTIIEKTVTPRFSAWAHLHHSGKGLEKKLTFAVALARSQELDGLVAVVDRDSDRQNQRKAALRRCRSALRDCGQRLPIALGVADPHVDVWLLDDAKAVRSGLGLPSNYEIPDATKVSNPKASLDEIICNSSEANENIQQPLARIAAEVRIERCLHADKTGYREFHSECL